MPVFIALVVIAAILVWILLSFAYKPLGRLVTKIWGDAKESMLDDDD